MVKIMNKVQVKWLQSGKPGNERENGSIVEDGLKPFD